MILKKITNIYNSKNNFKISRYTIKYRYTKFIIDNSVTKAKGYLSVILTQKSFNNQIKGNGLWNVNQSFHNSL